MALFVEEIAATRELVMESAREFYALTAAGKPQGLVLFALLRATLGLSPEQAEPIMDDVIARYERLTAAERQVLDPLAIGLLAVAHRKVLRERALTAEEHQELVRVVVGALADAERE